MNILMTYGGNSSLAMIQWASEQLDPGTTYVVSVDTGWSAPDWNTRMDAIMAWVSECGMHPIFLKAAMPFDDVMLEKQDFPTRKFQWCASLIKGMPILQWLDEADPAYEATVLIAHRRDVAPAYRHLPEHIEVSDFYGDRPVWHPLYLHTQEEVKALIAKTPIPWHNSRHRALECDPCINAGASELAKLPPIVVERATALEKQIGKPMFMEDVYQGAPHLQGFCQMGCPSSQEEESMSMFTMGCGDPYGCGT